jgi:hypothetical protein
MNSIQQIGFKNYLKIKTMVDNFDQIRSLLKFENVDDDFYFLQLLQRKKDNPDLSCSVKVVDDYYIYSLEQFDSLKQHIIQICTEKNARAYFRLNRRSAKKVGLQMLKKVTDLIINEQYKQIKNAYPGVVGEFHSDNDKSWLIDIDSKDTELLETVSNKAIELQTLTNKPPVVICIPTRSGYHLITRPFNLKEFKFPNVDIHKDNPTILFIP